MNNIRNFCIIAHIDHGKSTLADRLLEMTGTVEKRKMKEQILDSMDLERERGITIKLQPATMVYQIKGIDSRLRGNDNETKLNSRIREDDNKKELDPHFLRACLPVGRDDKKSKYILNLIDTPGHVDFGYEVSRSLAAVEGAVLLVDATKGVQAQTLANLYQAIEQDLAIIPVINKIDLPNAEVEKTKREILQVLGCAEEEIILASGKTGQGVDKILEAIVEKIPAPQSPLKEHWQKDIPLRALIFDSKYDAYKGVLAFVRIVDGEVKAGDEIYLMMGKEKSKVVEVGKFFPDLVGVKQLSAGDIGYIATGFKSVENCRVGDTITIHNFQFSIFKQFSISKLKNQNAAKLDSGSETGMTRGAVGMIKENTGMTSSWAEMTREKAEGLKISSSENSLKNVNCESRIAPLPGYKEVRPMVYASFYPTDGEDYNQMRAALEKLKLNDAALIFEGESSLALGKGFRLGFLGLLHLEIVQERLKREFGFEPIVTTPGVVYEIVDSLDRERKIYSAAEMPEPNEIKEIREPRVKLSIITPAEYLGNILSLTSEATRARYLATEYLDADRASLEYNAPLADVIINFHDALKSASSGFASMNYELCGYEAYDLVRLDIYVADEKVEAFSQIVPREKAESEGRKIVAKLKNVIPRQNFQIKLQAAVGGKMLARENIKAFRKDVTGYLYGGDYSRKKKLLEKQKRGKKRRGEHARAEIPQKAFLEILKR